MKICFIKTATIIFTCIFLIGCIKNIDENPTVTIERLIGIYSNSNEELTLNDDNTYALKKDVLIEHGTWSILDSNITLSANTSNIIYIKIYEVDGVYQLIIKDKKRQDPDTYDWSRVLLKT